MKNKKLFSNDEFRMMYFGLEIATSLPGFAGSRPRNDGGFEWR